MIKSLSRLSDGSRVERDESQKRNPLADLAVAAVPPFGLLPVALVVGCFAALVVVPGVVQCVLQTTLASLAETPEGECADHCGAGDACSYVDADVGACAEIVPLLG